MNDVIDARGLSCPQPVLETLNVIKKLANGEVTVLVDTTTSKENVTRAASNAGWAVDSIAEKEGTFEIILKK
jgi:tRNA 2-thiouridine synthesizing protein A